MKKATAKKLLIGLTLAAGVVIATPFVLYLKVLPYAVSNQRIINYVEHSAKKYAKLDINIEKPELKTSLSPKIQFNIKELSVTKDNKDIVNVKNFKSGFSFAEIFNKNLIVNHLASDYIYVDTDKVLELIPQQPEKPKKEQQSEWNIDFYDAFLGVRHCVFLYTVKPNTHIRVEGRNLAINNAIKTRRYIHFDLTTDITKGKEKLHLAIAENQNVYIENKAIYIKNCPLIVNNSKIFFNADAHKNKKYNLEIYSNDFDIQHVLNLINSQIIENNINEILAYFSDIKGKFDFNLKMTNSGMTGKVNIKNGSLKIVPVDNIPITLNKGQVSLDAKNLKLIGFEGYYDNKPSNKFNFDGTVLDYLKTMDTNIDGKAIATNDFFEKHLSTLANYPIKLKGTGDTKVNITYKNKIINVKGLFILDRDENILVDGEPLPFEKAKRAMTANLHMNEKMLLDIESINYYMESFNDKRNARVPIFSLNGQVDIAKNNYVNKVGFEIPEPLSSGFLNVIAKQRIFKKGTIAGKLAIDNTGSYPVLDGHLKVNKVRIPSQRLLLKNAELVTQNGLIHLNAMGKFKRSKYEFTGNIVNAIKYPIIVKDINLDLDYIDIYKAITGTTAPQQTATTQPSATSSQQLAEAQPTPVAVTTKAATTDDDDEDMGDGATNFDIGNLIIEKCLFNLKNGDYKDIHFGNLHANLTLDKNSNLKIESNRFDIAEGHSSVRVNCDLKKPKYNIVLGIKDVNSDVIASTLLNLPREISGKGSGLIDLSTDNSLKLDGSIKFLISNGTIQKVGLVEYALKFAALFRNPITMISPSTISDLVNIPEGNFDKITGNIILKDNVVEMMKIKSSAPQLSSYIIGRYDIENSDASLRIYTKFSNYKKGFAGALRSISLNSLANRMPMSSRNDANYYAVELKELPPLEAEEKDCQIFLTKVDGDVEHNNFLSSLKKIK